VQFELSVTKNHSFVS